MWNRSEILKNYYQWIFRLKVGFHSSFCSRNSGNRKKVWIYQNMLSFFLQEKVDLSSNLSCKLAGRRLGKRLYYLINKSRGKRKTVMAFQWYIEIDMFYISMSLIISAIIKCLENVLFSRSNQNKGNWFSRSISRSFCSCCKKDEWKPTLIQYSNS